MAPFDIFEDEYQQKRGWSREDYQKKYLKRRARQIQKENEGMKYTQALRIAKKEQEDE